MSKDSITLHPKYGVNPTLGQCFFCGGDTGEIGLLGYNKGKEAPHRSILNYEPCAKCKEQMAKGITLVEVDASHGQKRPEIVPGGVPTGRWLVITEEAVRKVFTKESTVEAILKARKAVVERGVFELLLPEDKSAVQPDKSDGEQS